MTKLLTIAALAVLLAVPAAVAAPPDGKGKPAQAAQRSASQSEQNAAKRCKAERQAMGVQAFANEYGTNGNKKNAFGKCVSAKSKDKPKNDEDEDEDEQGADSEAAKKCRAERQSMGAERFADEYGTNHNKKNAFGKCVSQKAKRTS